MTPRGGFPGLKDGCRWCLCVDRCVLGYTVKSEEADGSRWKEALVASAKLGDNVVPK
jgi:uncharacterized protein (DUF2237 family)